MHPSSNNSLVLLCEINVKNALSSVISLVLVYVGPLHQTNAFSLLKLWGITEEYVNLKGTLWHAQPDLLVTGMHVRLSSV